MSEVELYQFEKWPVRVIMRDGTPWWVRNDVCVVLGHANPSQAVKSLPAHQKGVHTLETPGGDQQLSIISEGGVYRLAFKSHKPSAARFTDWVTDEVLPAIRQTGSYTMPGRPAIQAADAALAREALDYLYSTTLKHSTYRCKRDEVETELWVGAAIGALVTSIRDDPERKLVKQLAKVLRCNKSGYCIKELTELGLTTHLSLGDARPTLRAIQGGAA